MGATGGGRGSNQYGARGTSVRRGSTPPDLGRATTTPPSSSRRDYYSEETLRVEVSRIDVSGVEPGSVDRAIARLRHRLPQLVYNDAALEGNTFTLPEVRTLIDGGSVSGRREEEEAQILALSEATDLVFTLARGGGLSPTKRLSDSIHAIVARHEAIESGSFRGEGSVAGGGTVNVMGDTYHAPEPGEGGGDLRARYDEALEVAAAIEHPLASATYYAAAAAYLQPYFDGNKRTARYVMNAVLLSHGYDAIVTPVAMREEYNEGLAAMYRTGDATPYAAFLARLYPRSK